MDFNFECVDTYDYVVTHPVNGQPTNGVVTLRSPDSNEYQLAMNPYLKAVSNGADVPMAASEFLSKIIVKWEGVEVDGNPLEFTQEAAKELLSTQPWFRNQLDIASSNRANFIKS